MLTEALLCLALNVYHEARGEPIEGQRAVAVVTMNRAGWDQSKICDVVFEPHQFSWTTDHKRKGTEAYMPKDEKAWAIAKRVAANVKYQRVPNPVGTATHFHTPAVSPAWSKKFKRVNRIGNHIFYVKHTQKNS